MFSLEKDSSGFFIIAEVGLNHNGDFGLAVKSIAAAAKAGVDAVKFQNYRTEDFLFDRSLTYTYLSKGKEITESLWDICKRCEMKREWLPELKKICDDIGIVFLSTPTSESGVKDLIDVGVEMIKNGSDYLTHLPLLKYMGTTGKTVIISTGMADEFEVQDAVDAVRSGGTSSIVLLHCTSSYPTKAADVNLNRMLALRERFNLPVGFSDHTKGSAAAIQAVALGACMLEKHFTLDNNLPGPDHWFSANPSDLEQYVSDVRYAEMRMGTKKIEPTDIEKINRKEFRLSLIASRNLAAGEKLSTQDFVISKPGSGLAPKDAEKIVGRGIALNIKKGTPLQWEHFE